MIGLVEEAAEEVHAAVGSGQAWRPSLRSCVTTWALLTVTIAAQDDLSSLHANYELIPPLFGSAAPQVSHTSTGLHMDACSHTG